MTRNQSRGISRRRLAIQSLSPTLTYSMNCGINPFACLFQKMFSQDGPETPEEKKIRHEVKMATEQKSAKARQNRKRNKV